MNYLIIETKDKLVFENFIRRHKENILYYLNNIALTESEIELFYSSKLYMKTKTPFTIPMNFSNSTAFHSDILNRNTKIYDMLISRLFEQSHNRVDLIFSNSLPSAYKKATIYVKKEINSQIILNCISQCVLMSITFKDQLIIDFSLLDNDNITKKKTIEIDDRTHITACHIDDRKQKDIKIITDFTQKQLDYLILLTYYHNGSEYEFLDSYIDNIFDKDYESLNKYFKVREMVFI